jgi:N-acetylglucosamine-6-phosphate deacetylase
MLNDAPDASTMARIAAAHLPFGTTSLLPTLITDTETVVTAAIEAATEAVVAVPGMLGLHLEGPYLAPARKGAHRAALRRCMSASARPGPISIRST